jgi:hypothetical protein
MNKLREDSYFDRSIQKLEYDIAWDYSRSQFIRNKLKFNIKKAKVRKKINKCLVYTASFILPIVFFLIVVGNINITSQYTGNISSGKSQFDDVLYKYEVVEGEKQLVLTEKGMEHLIYPLDAHKYINTLVGEPEIFTNGVSDNKVLTQAIYPTTTNGRNIYVHNSLNEQGSVDEMIKSSFINEKYPPTSYKVSELEISGQRAVLQEPLKDYGTTQLFIVTEKYIYYLSDGGMTKGNSKELSEELIKLAELFNFEDEY